MNCLKGKCATVSLAMGAVLLLGGIAFGQATSHEIKRGDWPETWPKALDSLREQARTYVVGTAYLGTTNHTVYEIEFTSREPFEKAWPELLKARDKGSPIMLSASPSFHDVLTGTLDAGVRIWAPSSGTAYASGKEWRMGPPWPKSALLPSGELPAYVKLSKRGRWAPFDKSNREEFFSTQRWRARTDIELVVDGKIVDLNRITFPPDTPIVDNRADDRGRAERRKAEEEKK
jgi:hypothetical protein